MIDRRNLLAAGALTGIGAMAGAAPRRMARPAPVDPRFPQGFLWGAATAGHQVEGQNVNSDVWFAEHVTPTVYAEPSGDAANSFNLWPTDMDLVRSLGLNTYRFSLEWARIEPAPSEFSLAMLDHYKAMIEGCRARGLNPVVTFNHFACPRWFAARGGWSNPQAPELFARYCDRAARHLAAGIAYALTLNEPNLAGVLQELLPGNLLEADKAMTAAAARALGVDHFEAGNNLSIRDPAATQAGLLRAHKLGRAAIKAVRPDLPVGVSLAMLDEQAVGRNSLRDAKRERYYGPWLRAVRGDDFVGVQNYERSVWTDKGKLPPPPGARTNMMGAEVYPPSLAGVVRYAHAVTGRPVLVTEHGVGTDDDTIRQWLIPEALAELKRAMAEGVPVLGYIHWSLVDNFEWVFGYRIHFGLCSLDRATFARTPKPSAHLLGRIARANALG
ncbi:glycoside hydrolase family 1 protein [Novosphingobium flavum]|uniref:Glycoside hydrolase family 1 protein n=1 Tax=Novosphingobium flavum TaxID=1778672 RepID=A0A7X1FSE4_9SPHN|nr:family 1 glycosylhydrolase [Novosphingobium flavum]MBC2665482.1 glycoside hydrolase family 1 protein [Novosphingobium flavum]